MTKSSAVLRDTQKYTSLKERADISIAEFETSAGFLLRIAQLSIFEQMYPLLKNKKVKMGEFSVLHLISENPGIRQGVMADILQVKWPSMTKLVNALELRGLLKRVVPVNDRRSIQLEITDKGRELVKMQRPEMMRANEAVFSMLNENEYGELVHLLRKVAGWEPVKD